MNVQPFNLQAKTLPISVTTAASTSTALPNKGNVIRIVNDGPNNAYVSVGTGTQVATLPNATPTATSTEVLAGSDVSFSIPDNAVLNISAITATGTATLAIQVGEGM